MEEKDQKGNENPPPPAAATAKARVFVGGLGEAVTADELRRVFELCGGAVGSIDFVRSKGRSFAYVDFSPSSHNSLSTLFAKYNGCVWKGGKLRLEKAKEHYLSRLAREWAEAEDKAKANGNGDADAKAHQAAATRSSSEVRQNLKDSDESIQIFFPRLGKVKKLPLSGTGKHKYSFQRIDVPSLPKYFCDCEEHSGLTERGKQIRHVEVETDGMDQEEVNIMTKVMNALFKNRNYDSADVSYKGDDSFKSTGDLHCEENDADEDDLLINVLSKGNNKVASLERQHVPQLSHDQPKKETLERRSKREWAQDAFTMQKENSNEPPSKKKKQLSRDHSRGDEFKSAILASKGNFHPHSDKSSELTEIQRAEPQSGKRQSNAHVSWSQKSSWKELVGDTSSYTFSIAPTEEVQRRSDAADIPASDNQNENLERDSIASTGKGQLRSDGDTSSYTFSIAPMEEVQRRSDAADMPASDNQNENLERDSIVSTGKGQLRSDASDGPGSDGENENLVLDGELEGGSLKKKTEGLVEALPAEPNAVSSQIRQGASWMQKLSWKQLVGQNSSFSLSDITSAWHAPTEPGGTGTPSSDNEKLNEMVNPATHGPAVFEAKADDESTKGVLKDDKQFIIANNEFSTSALEENCSVAVKQTSPVKVEISETCTFMRSATSLKEWSKTKAALSGSLKRKGNHK